jgi:hypothetical protein
MKREALWARPCGRGRTGILELEPKVSECAESKHRPAIAFACELTLGHASAIATIQRSDSAGAS